MGLLYGAPMTKQQGKGRSISWDWESRDAGPLPFSKSSSLLGLQFPFSFSKVVSDGGEGCYIDCKCGWL